MIILRRYRNDESALDAVIALMTAPADQFGIVAGIRAMYEKNGFLRTFRETRHGIITGTQLDEQYDLTLQIARDILAEAYELQQKAKEEA